LNFSEIKTAISIPSLSSSIYCISACLPSHGIANLINTCGASYLPEKMAKETGQDFQNITRNLINQKDSQLCVPISVSILVKTAIEKDLLFDDKNGYYSTEKILMTLTLIVYPRSLAELNYNPNKNETKYQTISNTELKLLLYRLCKKTYLMDSGWEIIRQIGPAGVNQPKTSTCRFDEGSIVIISFV
jgi:hypothetical protein